MRLRRWSDALGIAWVVLAAVVVMVPALRPGMSLGPFDLLAHFGLTYHPGVQVHNPIQADQIEQFVPWTDLAWRQVHSGHLPLWNPYSVLGMPLAFNWQSAVFSLPVAVSYLFPVHMAYAVIVLVKLVVAGTGAYVLCRVLGLRVLSAVFGGTVFELSGPILVHSGWSMVGVTAWSGWILTGVVLVLDGRRPVRATVLLAVAVALAVLGGHPESVVISALVVLTFIVVYLLSKPESRGRRSVTRVGYVVLAVVLGAAMASPLLLPGLQMGLASSRGNGVGAGAISAVHVPNLLGAFQGVDFRSSAYVGVITLTMAVLGTRAGWGRAYVRALAAVVVVTGLLTFVNPVDQLLHQLPGARAVAWSRAVMLLALALAVLGAVGIDELSKGAGEDQSLMRWATWTLSATGFVVVVLGLWGVLGVSAQLQQNKSGLLGPVAEIAVGLAVLWLPHRRNLSPRLRSAASALARHAAPILLVTETAVLIGSGVGFWSVSQGYFPATAGTSALQARVGSSLVGLGTCKHASDVAATTQGVGIRANANIAYGVSQFWVYDPIIPQSYYRLWRSVSGIRTPAALYHLGIFCAPITTAAQARLFGIGDVLEPAGSPGPSGSTPAGTVGDENLYRIPGSSRATLNPLPAPGSSLPWSAPGSPVAVHQQQDGTWRMSLDASTPQLLRMRLTAVAGWRATLDGKPLKLERWADGTMLEAQVPAGHHEVEVRYWPRLFSVGLVLALVAVVVCLMLLIIPLVAGGRPERDRSGKP